LWLISSTNTMTFLQTSQFLIPPSEFLTSFATNMYTDYRSHQKKVFNKTYLQFTQKWSVCCIITTIVVLASTYIALRLIVTSIKESKRNESWQSRRRNAMNSLATAWPIFRYVLCSSYYTSFIHFGNILIRRFIPPYLWMLVRLSISKVL